MGGGLNRKFYVEKKSYNLIKSVISNDEIKIITELADYRDVDGFSAPFNTKIMTQQLQGDKKATESSVIITDLKINPKIDGSLFDMKNVSKLPKIPGFDISDMVKSMFN